MCLTSKLKFFLIAFFIGIFVYFINLLDCLRVSDPDPLCKLNPDLYLDPDPYYSEKLDPDPH